jgi:hypothetical protein
MQVKLSSAFRIIGPRVRDIAEGVHGQRVRAATKAPQRAKGVSFPMVVGRWE